MRLLIDIGNTNIKIAMGNGKHIGRVRKLATGSFTSKRFARVISSLIGKKRVSSAYIASVVPKINSKVEKVVSIFVPLHVWIDHKNCGFRIKYPRPREIGADRLAIVRGALTYYKPPIIIVNSGTGTTIEMIDKNGAYHGGVLLPGLLLSAKALNEHTGKLPLVTTIRPNRIPGRSTRESISSGIYWGHIGAIEYFIRMMQKKLGGKATVIATSGAAGSIAKWCQFIGLVENEMVLKGLGSF